MRAWTPRSVRPAAVVAIGIPAIEASAGSRTSCTVPPPGWVCQPRKRLPSYSSPSAIRAIENRGQSPISDIPATAMGNRALTPIFSGQLGEQLLRLAFLRGVAVLHHFVQQLSRA